MRMQTQCNKRERERANQVNFKVNKQNENQIATTTYRESGCHTRNANERNQVLMGKTNMETRAPKKTQKDQIAGAAINQTKENYGEESKEIKNPKREKNNCNPFEREREKKKCPYAKKERKKRVKGQM